MGQGRKLDIHGMSALAVWAGMDLDQFVSSEGRPTRDADSMTQIRLLLRADKRLSKKDSEYLERIVKLTYDRLRETE